MPEPDAGGLRPGQGARCETTPGQSVPGSGAVGAVRAWGLTGVMPG